MLGFDLFHNENSQFFGVMIIMDMVVLVSLDTFKKYRYSDIREGCIKITDYDYDSSQYNDELSIKNDELQAEIEQLKKLLAEQNK